MTILPNNILKCMSPEEEVFNAHIEWIKRQFPHVSQSTLEANGILQKGGDASCVSNVPATILKDSYVQSTAQSNAAPTFKPKRAAKQPNKTEQAFADYHYVVTRHVLEFEPVKLRIGPNCYYTPDWGDLNAEKPAFYETKGGHIWDDSIVKFKAAKERHEWADFEMWQKKQGTWTRLL